MMAKGNFPPGVEDLLQKRKGKKKRIRRQIPTCCISIGKAQKFSQKPLIYLVFFHISKPRLPGRQTQEAFQPWDNRRAYAYVIANSPCLRRGKKPFSLVEMEKHSEVDSCARSLIDTAFRFSVYGGRKRGEQDREFLNCGAVRTEVWTLSVRSTGAGMIPQSCPLSRQGAGAL